MGNPSMYLCVEEKNNYLATPRGIEITRHVSRKTFGLQLFMY